MFASQNNYNLTLEYIYFYFKSIYFVMDIIPTIYKQLDNLYMDYIVKDALKHQWMCMSYSWTNNKILIPLYTIPKEHWCLTRILDSYDSPNLIYDDHFRRLGGIKRKRED